MLMDANNGRIDHLHGSTMGTTQYAQELGPHARPSPANERL